jgi:dTDP-4-dehydrorhamnose 3,5-epimerase
MNYIETEIPDLKIIQPNVFRDARGYFMETFQQAEFEQVIPSVRFVQENESCSTGGVIRGLHYQLAPYAQAKLVRVICGEVVDVAVDLRQGSPTFGKVVTVVLSEDNKWQLFIPQGFAHGFHVVSKTVLFVYKVDNYYAPQYERGIRYTDPTLHIDWQIADNQYPIVSEKDICLPLLQDAEMNFVY